MKVRLASNLMVRTVHCILFLVSICLWRCAEAAPASSTDSPIWQTEDGEIDGAKFSIARPSHWNHHVLLLAHGYVPAARPLIVDFAPEQVAYRTLLNEGWMIAKTSYRRNGIIVADAIADLNALRQHIIEKHGAPDRVILEGESMGGLIVTLMVERDAARYDGAVAIGAALKIDEPGSRIDPSHQPKRPLVFLSNQSELDGPLAYAAAPTARADPESIPAVFRVGRNGHVNVNQAERLAALRALNSWIDSGRKSLPPYEAGRAYHDATVVPGPAPSQVKQQSDRRGFTARVTHVSQTFGNVFISAQPADFAAVGIATGQWFELLAHDKSYRTYYGSDFGSVKEGEWVVFPDADGFFCVSRNFADAAGTAGLKAGDSVIIRQKQAPTN